MKVIKASYEILSITGEDLRLIELAGRTCYKSEDRISDGTAEKFATKILEGNHESVIEHSMMSVRFVVDRGVSHELVRHRMASFSQESTRYCNYSKGKFDGELTFVLPCFWAKDYTNPTLCKDEFLAWKTACRAAEESYLGLLKLGAPPQEARSVLPNSLKTEVVMSANFREWRHVFRLRTAKAAHPQMREVLIPLLAEAKQRVPVVFDDIEVA